MDRNSSLLVMAPTTDLIEDARRVSLRTYDLDHPEQAPTVLIQIEGSIFGNISRLIFNPVRPRTIAFCYEPGNDQGSTVYFWDLSNSTPSPSTDEMTDAVKEATDLLARRLPSLPVSSQTERLLENHLIDMESRMALAKLPQVPGKLASSEPFSHGGDLVLLVPGGRRYPNGREANRLIVHSVDREVQVELVGHIDRILNAKFSGSDALILSASRDSTIRVWTRDGACKFKWQTTGQNWTCIFDPNEQFVVATCGNAPRILCWSLENGDLLWTLPDSSSDWPRALDISSDGLWLAIGTMRNGGRVSLVDLSTDPPDGTRQFATIRRLGGRDGTESECETVQFLRRPGSVQPSVAYTTTRENGVEVFNLENDTKWRCEPATGDAYLCGWRVMPGGRLVTVYSDAIRVWQL